MEELRDRLRLTIGPLHYEFRAHDAWAEDALARLRTHVVCVEFAGSPDRMVHLAALGMTEDENDQINQDWLPGCFATLLPEGSPCRGWWLTGDETGYLTFRHDGTRQVLWIFGSIPALFRAPFQLPWPALLDDIVACGGGILHGGLIARGGHGYLVTAPPGGGKTTTISRLPAGWRVLADDACLVWPGAGETFLASPLPTWSVLLGRGEVLPAIGRWQIGASVPVGGILLLSKGDRDRLTPLPVLQALPALYQALFEHPQVVTNGNRHCTRLFDVARDLARAAPVWRLEATLDGQPWEGLPALARI
jgi:hypothetical protein